MTQTSLITGASSGIGRELARQFATNHHDLILVARRKKRLEELKIELEKRYMIKVHILVLDLSKLNSAKEVYDFTSTQKLKVDYLVNNAGFGDFGLFANSDWKKQQQMINLNISTLTQLCHLYLPQMIKRKSGKILNVASTAAFQPGPLMAVYYATKAYVLHFSEALSNEVKDHNISVTALCPGATISEFKSTSSMGKSNIFSSKKLPSSSEVAIYGYQAMMKGRTIAIHGLKNTILANFNRFAPRDLVVKIVRKLQSEA